MVVILVKSRDAKSRNAIAKDARKVEYFTLRLRDVKSRKFVFATHRRKVGKMSGLRETHANYIYYVYIYRFAFPTVNGSSSCATAYAQH